MNLPGLFRIHLVGSNGACLFSNIDGQDFSSLDSCDSENELIETGNGKARHGKAGTKYGTVYLISNSSDVCNSSNLFKKYRTFLLYVLPEISMVREGAIKNFRHDIAKIHGHNIQEIFSLVPQDEFIREKSAHSQIDFLRSIVEKNPEQTARILLKIIKNNSSISSEFTLLDSMFGADYIVQLDSHKIHKILNRALVTFYLDFKLIDVDVQIDDTEDSVIVDFETFKGALIPFFDNAIKYVLPNTDIKISFSNDRPDELLVNIDMISLKILDGEISQLTTEGFVGEMAKKSKKGGKGLGLFKVTSLVSKSGAIFKIIPSVEGKEVPLNGLVYSDNRFTFVLKKDIANSA